MPQITFGSEMARAVHTGSLVDRERARQQVLDGLAPEDAAVLQGAAARLNARAEGESTSAVKAGDVSGILEAELAVELHKAVGGIEEILFFPDFWRWFAVTCCPEFVAWRYGQPLINEVKLANYGIGSVVENLPYRLWLRAELVYDRHTQDHYTLARRGQVDFWRSHILRPGYTAHKPFAQAFVEHQYPGPQPMKARHAILEVRELAKRLARLRSNLVYDVLDRKACADIIQMEAEKLPPRKTNVD